MKNTKRKMNGGEGGLFNRDLTKIVNDKSRRTLARGLSGFLYKNDTKSEGEISEISKSSGYTVATKASKVTTGISIIDNTSTILENIILFVLYFFILFIVAIVFDQVSKKQTGFSEKYFTYSFASIFIIVSILIAIFGGRQVLKIQIDFPFLVAESTSLTRLAFLTFAILICVAVTYYFNISKYLLIGILILMAVVGLAIIFNQFYGIFERSIQNSKLKFVIEMIFFLPCLLNDILAWFLEQINMTPYITYVLLLIEFILIFSYFYLPTVLKKTLIGGASDGQLLQDTPYFINRAGAKTIATSANFKMPKSPDGSEILDSANPYYKDYALSFWVNLNTQSISSDMEINIISYGYPTSYKPKVVYSVSSSREGMTSIKDVYRIYFTKGSDNFYEISVPSQKWNHFLLNYINGEMVEIWVNGVMERVFKFENKVLPDYSASDKMVIGNEGTTGTNGAICSVIYFNHSIQSSQQIVNLYNIGIKTSPYPGIQQTSLPSETKFPSIPNPFV